MDVHGGRRGCVRDRVRADREACSPKTGLIVDVRGNGGGNILCAEKLLQVLTPASVEPVFLCVRQFAAYTRHLQGKASLSPSGHPPSGSRWKPARYTPGASLSCRRTSTTCSVSAIRVHVVLITDPLCYSATDIFAAGFQDNRIGPILSAGGRTGAGRARCVGPRPSASGARRARAARSLHCPKARRSASRSGGSSDPVLTAGSPSKIWECSPTRGTR